MTDPYYHPWEWEPCEWPEGPPCGPWLAGASDTEPNHICLHAAAESVEWFIGSRMAFGGRERLDYLITWPLPVGAASIREWWRSPPKKTGMPPVPVCAVENALAGVALHRGGATWRFWLLGLVEAVPGEPGVLRFAEPLLLAEGEVDCEECRAEARRCRRWYQRVLLGKKAPGRPPGTYKSFRTREEFVEACQVALQELREAGAPPTEATFVDFLSYQDAARIDTEDSDTLLRQFRRWLHRFGFTDYPALLETLERSR